MLDRQEAYQQQQLLTNVLQSINDSGSNDPDPNIVYSQLNQNLELAIHYSEAVLEVITEKYFPIKWSRTQYNLATYYQICLKGNQKQNYEKATNS